MQEKEKSAGKAVRKKSWFQGLKSEFKKIVWVDRPTLVKQTIAVVIITSYSCSDHQCHGFCYSGRN